MICRRHWIILLTLVMAILTGTAHGKGEIRCYCNLPVCVGTGYMCKSALGVCFSEAAGPRQPSDPGKSRHGCAELMSPPRRDVCLQRVFGGADAAAGPAAGSGTKYPFLGCCREDMCNYPDSVDIKIRINARVNHSHTAASAAAAGLPSTVEESEFIFGAPPSEDATSAAAEKRDLWFKAAVIAVPIAGGFILLLLVLVAVHMLRRDQRHHRQVVELRQQYKAHLLVDEEQVIAAAAASAAAVIDKNETHAKLNKMASGECKPNNNVYRNVNVTICRDGSGGCGDLDARGSHDRRYAGKLLGDSTAFRSAVTVSWNGGECKPSTRV